MSAPQHLRSYQERIVAKAMQGSTVAILPTGSGKTLIAAELLHRRPPPAVFLVPTRVLVEQQCKALAAWLQTKPKGKRVAGYHGEMALPQPGTFDIIVSTPEAFLKATRRGDLPRAYTTLVFDEVHHVLKQHPYQKVAREFIIPGAPIAGLAPALTEAALHAAAGGFARAPGDGSSVATPTDEDDDDAPLAVAPIGAGAVAPLVLGLSASVTYKVGEAAVKKDMQRLCTQLGVVHIESAGADELKIAGFHATAAITEVSVPLPCVPGIIPLAERKPHLMAPTFWGRYDTKRSTPFAAGLVAVIEALEAVVAANLTGHYVSPLRRCSQLAEWDAYASKWARALAPGSTDKAPGEMKKKLGPAGPLVARGCDRAVVSLQCGELEHWYVALRLLVVSWEEGQDAAAMYLHMCGLVAVPGAPAPPVTVATAVPYAPSSTEQPGPGKRGRTSPIPVPQGRALQVGAAPWTAAADAVKARLPVPRELARLGHLKAELRSRAASSFRGVLFAEQRVSVHVLRHFIAADPDLREHFRPVCIHALSPATPSLGITAAQCKERLTAFRDGTANLLISTAVGEEGLDVPAANTVLCFDAVTNPVSFIQGRGRAREANSAHVALAERPDRTVADLAKANEAQLAVAQKFTPAMGAVSQQQQAEAQRSRERGAAASLAKGGLAGLNEYVSKTKAVMRWVEPRSKTGPFSCTGTYSSCLREVTSAGSGTTLKAAKLAAAEGILAQIRVL